MINDSLLRDDVFRTSIKSQCDQSKIVLSHEFNWN